VDPIDGVDILDVAIAVGVEPVFVFIFVFVFVVVFVVVFVADVLLEPVFDCIGFTVVFFDKPLPAELFVLLEVLDVFNPELNDVLFELLEEPIGGVPAYGLLSSLKYVFK